MMSIILSGAQIAAGATGANRRVRQVYSNGVLDRSRRLYPDALAQRLTSADRSPG
jgi:hypothetical protein